MEAAAPIVKAPSLLAEMAAKYSLSPKAFEDCMKATVMPSTATNEELCAFLIVARESNLNPVLRQIYAFPKKGGGIQPVVGVDGWIGIVNSRPVFDGVTFADALDKDGKITAITCTMHRKDMSRPITVTEYLNECKRGTEPWNQWPARMLRHKAYIQCARVAFGLSGIVDEDEAERIKQVEGVVIERKAPERGSLSLENLKPGVVTPKDSPRAQEVPAAATKPADDNRVLLEKKQAEFKPEEKAAAAPAAEEPAKKKVSKKGGFARTDGSSEYKPVAAAPVAEESPQAAIEAADDLSFGESKAEPESLEAETDPVLAALEQLYSGTSGISQKELQERCNRAWKMLDGDQQAAALQGLHCTIKDVGAFNPLQLRNFLSECITAYKG